MKQCKGCSGTIPDMIEFCTSCSMKCSKKLYDAETSNVDNEAIHKGLDDMVNKPPHYNQGKIEVLDFILDQNMSYLQANCVKYLCRYKFKNGKEDLEKARFYLDKLIETYE